MKFVGVKHQPGQEETYWFEVPNTIAHLATIGQAVVCDTRRGNMSGTIVQTMEGIDSREASRIIGNYFPLKKIISITTDFEVAEIHIPWDIANSNPEPNEIATRVSEFYNNGRFLVDVVCTADGNLKEGYTAYLVAKMFGHDTIHGQCVA